MKSSLRLSSVLRGLGAFSGALPAPVGVAAPRASSGTPLPDDVARLLEPLPPARRRTVLDPLAREKGPGVVGRPRRLSLPTVGGAAVPARQVDGTTCGSAVLSLLALAGDPRLALRLGTGDVEANWASLQRATKKLSNRRGLVLARWPDRFGTPPWGAAAAARFGEVRYTHRVVGRPERSTARRGRRPSSRDVLATAVEAARSGVPVPLFTGGDLRRGVGTAVPRHVVLLTLADGTGEEGSAVVYEPGSAALHTVPVRALLDPPPGGPVRAALTAALGGWPHVAWALLPTPTPTPTASPR